MKKYLQYNASQYIKQQAASDVGARPGSRVSEVQRNDVGGGQVLDLSGKPGQNSVAMVTGQKWKSEVEQHAALDLSRGKLLDHSDQCEALDLSKPSTSRAQHVPSPRPSVQSPNVHLPHHGLQSPPTTNHSKPGIGQYSLLQAALNSAPPNTAVAQGFEKMAQFEAELRARMIAGGIVSADSSRMIKPFSTVPSRPLGISVPRMAVPNSSIAVVQGIHTGKPVAITTPQPHQPLVTAKSHSVTQGAVSVNNTSQSVNPSLPISQSEYMCRYQGQAHNQSTSPKGTMGMHGGYIKRGEAKRDQFVIRTPDSTSHIINSQNYVKVENLHGYACSQCPKMFKNKAALKLHSTVHKTSEERQYECQVCQRRFLHRHHLVVHQRKHSGEKPFKCNACSKTFMAIFLLHKHLRKHVRENSMNSVISTEQLQQLHVRKMTSDGPDGNHGIVGNVTNPVIMDGSRVTVAVDGQSKLDMTKEKIILNEMIKDAVPLIKTESKEDDNTVITISSDELNSSTSTLSISNSSVLKDLKDIPEHSVETKQDVQVNENNTAALDTKPIELPTASITSKPVSTVSEPINTFHQEIVLDTSDVNSSKAENKVDTEVVDEPEKQDVEHIQENEKQSQESVNPFPMFASDDEVELDYETGELKIVDKGRKHAVSDNETVLLESATEILRESTTAENNSKAPEDSNIEKEELKTTTSEQTQETIKENKDTAVVDSEKDKKESKENITDSTLINVTDEKKKTVVEKKFTEKEGSDNEKENSNSDIQTIEETQFDEIDNVKVNSKETDSDRKRKSSECIDHPEPKRLSLDNEKGEVTKDITMKESVSIPITELNVNQTQTIAETRKIKLSKKGRKAKCELCHRTFHSNHHLLLHMVVHKKNPMLISLKKAKANQMKVLGYNGKSSVNCEICKKVFKFQKSLNSHMRVHSEKLRQNKLLSKAFRDFMAEAVPPSQRSHHVNSDTESQEITDHGEKNPVEQQESIKGTFDNEMTDSDIPPVLKKIEPDIDPPIRVIIGKDQVKRFVCHACNNTYTTKQKLKMHALIHKDNCFLCDICGKSFFREVTLEKHIATHLLPRPYICPLCKKSFIHRSSLMRHKVVHEKPAMPNLKQQVADVNFELKMLDTYTMLRQERMQKLQVEKMNELKIEPDYLENKVNVLDLSVRVKMDDSSLPPVLSPAISQSSIPPQSSSELSPPLITKETNIGKVVEHYEQLKCVKQDPGFSNEGELIAEVDKGKKTVGESRKRTLSSEVQGIVNSDANTFQKVARKTRVYETSCRVCRERFPNVMSLKTHMAVHNTVETHLYECHICQHRFTQSCSLLRHLKTSCQENRMTCVPCGKTFHRRNTYDQHMRIHQGGPPGLVISFYDKRKDEAEMKEEVERESDIENNNTKIAGVSAELQPVKTEPVTVSKFIPSELNVNENSSDSTDSDARTYLYSEGEVHIGHLSDFSDTDFSPPQSPKPDISRSALPANASPNTMTLNLLSAVCSDIRNAEKEEEERKKEIEERQKELETIEILANLKRGAMQNNIQSENSRRQEMKFPIRSPSHSVHDQVVDLSQVKHDTAEADLKKTGIHHVMEEHFKGRIKVEPPDTVSSESDDCRIVRHSFERDIKVSTNSKEPHLTIPTVVLEVNAEAERLRKEKLERMKQNQPIQFQTGKDNMPIIDEKTQKILKELSQMNVYNSIIQDRLSLLMKAQPSSSLSQKPSSSSSSAAAGLVTMTTSPHLVTSTSPKVYPSSAHNFRTDLQNNPQDLSVKKPTTPIEGIDLKSKIVPQVTEGSRSESSTPALPPLVPVFRCELCGKVMYNNSELCIHMREHNVSPESFRKKPPFVAIGDPRWNFSNIKTSRTPEESSTCVTSSTLADNTATDQVKVKVTPPVKKVTPPLTLDLSLKPSPSKSKLLANEAPSLPSPLTGSDLSDAVSSPTTPSSAAGNLDHLRIELRNKIYARRRSQGLEELTVEFKSPEPTEMTEDEKKKLDYRRECNRQAAQRSRMRKKDLVDSLLEELHKEEIVNGDLRRKMECLSAEKNFLLKVLDSHTCVNDNIDSETK